MDLMFGQPGRQPAVLCKNIKFRYYAQTFLTKFVIHAMLIGTIDFFDVVTISVTMTFGWGSQSQCKAKPADLILLHMFQVTSRKFYVVFKQFKINILIPLLSEI